MSELLTAVQQNPQSDLDSALHHLRRILEELSGADILAHPSEWPLLSGTVRVPFRKPRNVAVIGSFLLHTLAKPQLNVDVAMTMPSVS